MAKREELIHYIDTSMGQEEASYALIGDGVSSISRCMSRSRRTRAR